VVRARFEVTVPEESLPRVLERFAAQESERLPVVRDLASRRLVGTISKRDILSVYSLELLQRAAVRRPPRPIEAAIDTLVDEVPLPPGLEGQSFAESRFPRARAAARAPRLRGHTAARGGAALHGRGPPRGVRSARPHRGAAGAGGGRPGARASIALNARAVLDSSSARR
jgi:CBS domain-containing protein